MDFVIRRDARDWFAPIKSSLVAPTGLTSAPDFDAFYFCFIAGIVAGQKAELPVGDERIAIVENFPGPYKSRGRLLVSVFLSYELEYLGVAMGEKDIVHTQIAHLVEPNSQNYLTDQGVQEFSRYASGGFDVLLDWFDDSRPRSLSSFLRIFKKGLRDALQR